MKTVRIHVKEKWILLYIERWLTILYLEKIGIESNVLWVSLKVP